MTVAERADLDAGTALLMYFSAKSGALARTARRDAARGTAARSLARAAVGALLGASVRSFARRCLAHVPGACTPTATLYAAYVSYCKARGDVVCARRRRAAPMEWKAALLHATKSEFRVDTGALLDDLWDHPRADTLMWSLGIRRETVRPAARRSEP